LPVQSCNFEPNVKFLSHFFLVSKIFFWERYYQKKLYFVYRKSFFHNRNFFRFIFQPNGLHRKEDGVRSKLNLKSSQNILINKDFLKSVFCFAFAFGKMNGINKGE